MIGPKKANSGVAAALSTVAKRLEEEPFYLIATTIGEPALKFGDFIPIEVFYHNEVVLRDGQTVPFSEL